MVFIMTIEITIEILSIWYFIFHLVTTYLGQMSPHVTKNKQTWYVKFHQRLVQRIIAKPNYFQENFGTQFSI